MRRGKEVKSDTPEIHKRTKEIDSGLQMYLPMEKLPRNSKN
jgi:hypothetical protein